MEKLFGRDHVIARLQKLQLAPQRISANQVAVQSWIPHFVTGWEDAMVSHDRRASARRAPKVPAPGQSGKDDVLQSRTDESQGYLSKDSAELYRTVPRFVLEQLAPVPSIHGASDDRLILTRRVSVVCHNLRLRTSEKRYSKPALRIPRTDDSFLAALKIQTCLCCLCK